MEGLLWCEVEEIHGMDPDLSTIWVGSTYGFKFHKETNFSFCDFIPKTYCFKFTSAKPLYKT